MSSGGYRAIPKNRHSGTNVGGGFAPKYVIREGNRGAVIMSIWSARRGHERRASSLVGARNGGVDQHCSWICKYERAERSNPPLTRRNYRAPLNGAAAYPLALNTWPPRWRHHFETRHTSFPTSSATRSAPVLSMATPTGRPRATPSSVRKPVRKSAGGPEGFSPENGTNATR